MHKLRCLNLVMVYTTLIFSSQGLVPRQIAIAELCKPNRLAKTRFHLWRKALKVAQPPLHLLKPRSRAIGNSPAPSVLFKRQIGAVEMEPRRYQKRNGSFHYEAHKAPPFRPRFNSIFLLAVIHAATRKDSRRHSIPNALIRERKGNPILELDRCDFLVVAELEHAVEQS